MTLELRPIPDSDAAAYLDMFNDPTVARNAGTVPHPIDLDWIMDRLATRRAGEADGTMADRGLYLDGVLVGSTGWFIRDHGLEIGYTIHRDHRGKGLATKACRLAVRLAREHRRTGPVFANHFQDNPASGRVLAKCGFIVTGDSVATSKGRDGDIPSVNTQLTGDLALLDPVDGDYPALYAFACNADQQHQAAGGRAPESIEAYKAMHERAIANGGMVKTLLLEGEVVGSFAVFERFGNWEISYWIGREHGGKGLATRGLALWLEEQPLPESGLYARVAKDHGASRRVLEKGGFRVVGEDSYHSDIRGTTVEEYLYRLGE